MRFLQVALITIHLFSMVRVMPGQEAGNHMLLTTGGHVGTVRALRFSPDSRRLFAGGIDKQVHVWDLYNPIDVAKQRPLDPQHRHYLRWQVGRTTLGSIYAMDVSASGDPAFGGFSSFGHNGDIVIYDPARRAMIEALPRERPAQASQPKKGHRATVIGLSWSPTGRQLVSVSNDGEVRYWPDDENRNSRLLAAPDTARNARSDLRAATFLDDTHVAFAVPASKPIGADDCQISIWRVGSDTRSDKKSLHHSGVTAIERDRFAGSRWASADGYGQLFLWDNLADTEPKVIDLWERFKVPSVSNMQFAPDNHLLISTVSQMDSKRPASLLLLDLSSTEPKLVDQCELGQAVGGYPCAVSPDGKLAAAYAGDLDQVWLYQLDFGKRESLQAANRVVLQGGGRRFFDVKFMESESPTIAISTDPPAEGARYDLGFDFARCRLLERIVDSDSEESNPRTKSPETWSLTQEAGSKLTLLGPNGQRRHIDLDIQQQGPFKTHHWLRDGQGKTVAVAIATSGEYGIYLYDLVDPGPNQPCRLLRYFRDHRGEITSLASSSDRRYLASASLDQTIKIWPLQDLWLRHPTFARAGALGAVFEIGGEPRGLRIASVDDRGIVAQRGMRAGDPITRIQIADGDKVRTFASPESMLDVLRTRDLYRAYSVTIDNRKEAIEIIAGWQPMLSLFISRDGQWAVWTPQGYYNASVKGDEFFGWVRNQGRDKKPGFYLAAFMRDRLEKPAVIRNLLRFGDLRQALERDNNEGLPQNYLQPVGDLLSQIPEVEILRPLAGAQVGDGKQDKPVPIEALVTYVNKQQIDDYEVRAFVNQATAVGQAVEGDLDLARRYRFDIEATDPESLVQVQLISKIDGGELRHEDHVAVGVPSAALRREQLRIHYVGIGGSSYPDGWKKLPGSKDVMRFEQKLALLSELSNYELVETYHLLDSEVSRESIGKLIKLFNEGGRVRTGDLLIVFLAGHGEVARDGVYYFIPAVEGVKLDGGRLTSEMREEYCISAADFVGLLKLPCRKIVIVDTCHAGGLGDNSKYQVRRWNNDNIVVWCSTSGDQKAFAHDDQSFFMAELADAIEGHADLDEDGFVELQETNQYVSSVLNGKYGISFPSPQTYFPEGASRLMRLPLFKRIIKRDAMKFAEKPKEEQPENPSNGARE